MYNYLYYLYNLSTLFIHSTRVIFVRPHKQPVDLYIVGTVWACISLENYETGVFHWQDNAFVSSSTI